MVLKRFFFYVKGFFVLYVWHIALSTKINFSKLYVKIMKDTILNNSAIYTNQSLPVPTNLIGFWCIYMYT